MAYLAPAEFVTKMVDAGEAKIYMATRDALIRAYMAGAILALAAVFAVTATVMTGQPLVGAILFPVGFCMLYLLGFDLLTGVFTLAPLAVLDRRPGATWNSVMRNWSLTFIGNFAGAITVAVFMTIIFTNGFTEAPNAVGQKIGHIGEGRTVGYAAHGAAGMLTLDPTDVLGLRGAIVNTASVAAEDGQIGLLQQTCSQGNTLGHGSRIAGAIGEKHPLRPMGQHLLQAAV